MTCDVIIPSHDNMSKHGSLAMVLRALSFSRDVINRVFVVSNGDTPQCVQYLEDIVCGYKWVDLSVVADANRAAARNIGIERSKADYCIFLDDDIICSRESMRRLLKALKLSNFVCGAWRRYVPMGWHEGHVRESLESGNYEALDRAASDMPAIEASRKWKYEARVEQSSFITCFGGASRSALLSAGQYDPRYHGWGLEDTDLMTRLIAIRDYDRLSDVTVWHLDHMVSPYTASEHWGTNWNTYSMAVGKLGYLHLSSLFARDHVKAADPSVLIPPGLVLAEEFVHTDTSVGDAVRSYVDEVARDNMTAAVILHGSALFKERPEDIDIYRITYYGKPHFKYRVYSGHKIEEQVSSIDGCFMSIAHPHYSPERWPLSMARFVEGQVVWERVRIVSLLQTAILTALSNYWLHNLTYYLGVALHASRCSSVVDRYQGLFAVAVVIEMAANRFPVLKEYPYVLREDSERVLDECLPLFTEGSREGNDLSLLTILDPFIREIMTHYDGHQHGRRIIYPASYKAIAALERYYGNRIPYETLAPEA